MTDLAPKDLNGASRTPILPVIAVLVTVVLWASAFVAIRYVGRELSAGTLTLGRLVVGSVVLGAVLIVSERRWPGRREDAPPRRNGWPTRGGWLRVVACGVLWFGVYNVALNEAERHVDAGTAAMLVNVGPILVAILAGLTLGEGFPRPLIAGSLVAFAGVVVIGVSTSSATSADWWGALLCLIAAVAYAIAVVVQKPLLDEVSALRVTWLACTVGAIACLPFGPALVRELGWAQSSTIGWLLYLGALPTAVAFTTWAYALARTSAGRLGATTYLVPPLAIIMGWAALAEAPPLLAFAGGALCLAGVFLSRRGARGS